jgi:hypothetical protein
VQLAIILDGGFLIENPVVHLWCNIEPTAGCAKQKTRKKENEESGIREKRRWKKNKKKRKTKTAKKITIAAAGTRGNNTSLHSLKIACWMPRSSCGMSSAARRNTRQLTGESKT